MVYEVHPKVGYVNTVQFWEVHFLSKYSEDFKILIVKKYPSN